MATKLEQKFMPCTCRSAYQDKRYGLNMRLHNPQQGKNEGKYRCTVCANSRGG